MTESWTIYIRVRGETTDSLYKTYEDLDEDGINRINRTGRAKVISTNCFECSEHDEIGIDVTVEVPDEFDDMYDNEKETMIYEIFTCEYVESWLGWFRDDLDDEDWRISVRYNGSCDTYEDGYYDGSPKENVYEDEDEDEDKNEDIIYITEKDINSIYVLNLFPPSIDSKDNVQFDLDDDSIEVNDVVYREEYGDECIIISMSGIGTKYVKDVSIINCTFKCWVAMCVSDFSEAYREREDLDNCVEFYDGEITIINKETNKIKKWEIDYPTSIHVYFNKD